MLWRQPSVSSTGAGMTDEGIPDFYAVLGIDESASVKAINDAWRSASKRCHPDAGGTSGLFRLITLARDTLIEPDSRAAYDQERARQRPRERAASGSIPMPELRGLRHNDAIAHLKAVGLEPFPVSIRVPAGSDLEGVVVMQGYDQGQLLPLGFIVAIGIGAEAEPTTITWAVGYAMGRIAGTIRQKASEANRYLAEGPRTTTPEIDTRVKTFLAKLKRFRHAEDSIPFSAKYNELGESERNALKDVALGEVIYWVSPVATLDRDEVQWFRKRPPASSVLQTEAERLGLGVGVEYLLNHVDHATAVRCSHCREVIDATSSRSDGVPDRLQMPVKRRVSGLSCPSCRNTIYLSPGPRGLSSGEKVLAGLLVAACLAIWTGFGPLPSLREARRSSCDLAFSLLEPTEIGGLSSFPDVGAIEEARFSYDRDLEGGFLDMYYRTNAGGGRLIVYRKPSGSNLKAKVWPQPFTHEDLLRIPDMTHEMGPGGRSCVRVVDK
jgi:curved DNA-binding protein CbpA